MQGAYDPSMLDVIRTIWPILLALITVVIWLGGTHFITKQTRDDFREFRQREYSSDKAEIMDAIKDSCNSQEKTEIRLEAKLEKMGEMSQAMLGRVHEEVSKLNIALARVEGKLSNMHNLPSRKESQGRA
jgi:hypothetical protein